MAKQQQRFQFFVVVRNPDLDLDLQRIITTDALQLALTKEFARQSEELLGHDIERKAFAPSYTPSNEEACVIEPFAPSPLLNRSMSSPQEFSEITMPFTANAPIVKAIMAVDDGTVSGQERFFFQHFDRTHILTKERTFLFREGMFHRLDDPGVTIAGRLAAIIVNNELIFRSFHKAKQFLDLDSFYRDATDSDIKEILDHSKLLTSDGDDIIASCSAAMRKKFSIVYDSKILDDPKATLSRIRLSAKKFGMELKVKDKRIVFPDTKRKQQRFLKFLAEELYLSPITDRAFETNSHRPFGGKGSD